MKTYTEYLDEVSKEKNHLTFHHVCTHCGTFMIHSVAEESAKRYATEAVKEALEKASENADIICGNKKKYCTACMGGGCEMPIVDKSSILNTKIELP